MVILRDLSNQENGTFLSRRGTRTALKRNQQLPYLQFKSKSSRVASSLTRSYTECAKLRNNSNPLPSVNSSNVENLIPCPKLPPQKIRSVSRLNSKRKAMECNVLTKRQRLVISKKRREKNPELLVKADATQADNRAEKQRHDFRFDTVGQITNINTTCPSIISVYQQNEEKVPFIKSDINVRLNLSPSISFSTCNFDINQVPYVVHPDYRLKKYHCTSINRCYTLSCPSHDLPDQYDLLKITPYVTDIIQSYFQAECTARPHRYMDNQEDINSKMRAILVDWLVEVHMKFRLAPATLYLTINIIDRYCSVTNVKRSQLQLVGITSLFVACKYEEIYPPEVRDCVCITDRAYQRKDVLNMEQDIVHKLRFQFTVPTAYAFLLRFLNIVQASPIVHHAANYYMERTLQEHELLKYAPSCVCAASVLLAYNNPDFHNGEKSPKHYEEKNELLLEYTGFEIPILLEIASIIAQRVAEEPVTASRRQLVAVKRKYDARRYGHVSTSFPEPKVEHIFKGSRHFLRESH